MSQFVNASAGELLTELNRVEGRTDLAPLVGLAAIATVVFEFYQRAPVWVLVLTLVVGIALIVYTRHRDVMQGTAILHYDLDGDAQSRFDGLKTAFAQFTNCQGLWHIDAKGATDDWKRHAGATGLIRRTAIRPGLVMSEAGVSGFGGPAA